PPEPASAPSPAAAPSPRKRRRERPRALLWASVNVASRRGGLEPVGDQLELLEQAARRAVDPLTLRGRQRVERRPAAVGPRVGGEQGAEPVEPYARLARERRVSPLQGGMEGVDRELRPLDVRPGGRQVRVAALVGRARQLELERVLEDLVCPQREVSRRD